jgi:hypothetical protein
LARITHSQHKIENIPVIVKLPFTEHLRYLRWKMGFSLSRYAAARRRWITAESALGTGTSRGKAVGATSR